MQSVHHELTGVLDFQTVPQVWPGLQEKIRSSQRLQVSLKKVEQANSAALAMLLQAVEEAHRAGCELRYVHLPSDLQALAAMSHVESLLPT